LLNCIFVSKTLNKQLVQLSGCASKCHVTLDSTLKTAKPSRMNLAC